MVFVFKYAPKKAMLIKVMMFTQMGVVEHGKYKNALYDVEYPSEYKKIPK